MIFPNRLHNSKKKIEPAKDPKYMLQVVSSAIVNTPPPPPVIMLVATLGKKRHKTLHYIDTDETLIDMFETDVSRLARDCHFRRVLISLIPRSLDGRLQAQEHHRSRSSQLLPRQLHSRDGRGRLLHSSGEESRFGHDQVVCDPYACARMVIRMEGLFVPLVTLTYSLAIVISCISRSPS